MSISLLNKEKAGLRLIALGKKWYLRQNVITMIFFSPVDLVSQLVFIYGSEIKFPLKINLLQWKSYKVVAKKN